MHKNLFMKYIFHILIKIYQYKMEINISNPIHKSNSRSSVEENLQKSLDKAKQNILELTELTMSKDAEILRLNQALLYHEEIIKKQICEIQTLCSEIVQFQFYKPHPKDTYLINFGHAKYRGWTYRTIISSREGKKFCKWVLGKTTADTEPVKEFKRYLREVGFQI